MQEGEQRGWGQQGATLSSEEQGAGETEHGREAKEGHRSLDEKSRSGSERLGVEQNYGALANNSLVELHQAGGRGRYVPHTGGTVTAGAPFGLQALTWGSIQLPSHTQQGAWSRCKHQLARGSRVEKRGRGVVHTQKRGGRGLGRALSSVSILRGGARRGPGAAAWPAGVRGPLASLATKNGRGGACRGAPPHSSLLAAGSAAGSSAAASPPPPMTWEKREEARMMTAPTMPVDPMRSPSSTQAKAAPSTGSRV